MILHLLFLDKTKIFIGTFYRIFFLGLGYMIWVVENLGSNYQVSVVRGCVRRCSNNQFVPSAQCWFFCEIYLALFGFTFFIWYKNQKNICQITICVYLKQKKKSNKITQIFLSSPSACRTSGASKNRDY